MSYFATFRPQAGSVFRLDTRIYLTDHVSPREDDVCVAAIVGKNPGSASSVGFGTLAPLLLCGDKMLPSVRNRFISAYDRASKPIPRGAFVRVWNLFYLCDAELASAIRSHKALAQPFLCDSEREELPRIVWFAWGGAHPGLDRMKARFRSMSPAHAFFYDRNRQSVTRGMPQATDFPKHPQGLVEEPIVQVLSELL